jgi:hypothetical protein
MPVIDEQNKFMNLNQEGSNASQISTAEKIADLETITICDEECVATQDSETERLAELVSLERVAPLTSKPHAPTITSEGGPLWEAADPKAILLESINI